MVIFCTLGYCGLGGQTNGDDGVVFAGRVFKGEYSFIVSGGGERSGVLHQHVLCLGVKDLKANLSAEVALGEVLDNGTQAALVPSAQETGQVEAGHQFLAGDGLCLNICSEEVARMSHAKQLPGGETLWKSEREGDFTRHGVTMETRQEGRRLIEVRTQGRGSRGEGSLCG